MKYVLFIGDGMADFGQAALGNKTPLEYLAPEGMARIASGETGRIRTCPEGMAPGSDVAFLTLLGNDTPRVYAGRSTLEAAGMDVVVRPGEAAFRLNLVSLSDDGVLRSHNGGGIEGEDALTLLRDCKKDPGFGAFLRKYALSVYETDTFRHIGVMPGDPARYADLTPPHDIAGRPFAQYVAGDFARELLDASRAVLSRHPVNEKRRAAGLLPANALWCWGAGGACRLENFSQKYGVRAVAVSAVPLVKGIARLGGIDAPDIPGATGLLDTDYEGKANFALRALREGCDFALVHLEAPDEMSHDGSLENKLEAVSRLDARVIRPMLRALADMGDFRAMVMPDHYTLLSTRTHDGTPVPFALYDSRRPGRARPFTEALCADKPVLESGDELMRLLFDPQSYQRSRRGI